MAYDRYSTTHHLTPDAWHSDTERPNDAVETWVCNVEQASGFSTEHRNWHCVWADPAVDRTVRDEIREKLKAAIGMVANENDRVETSVGKPL